MRNRNEVYCKTDGRLTWRNVSDLFGENDRLRRRLAELEAENAALSEEVASFRKLYDLDQEAADFLERQLIDVEGQRQRFTEQTTEFGRQNTHLASLYAASSCLHETADKQEVLETIRDIILNLIGSQELAIYELNPEGTALELAYSTGLEPEISESVPVERGLIGRVARIGEPFFAGLDPPRGREPEERHLTAAVPLRLRDRVTGVVAVFRLLPQKAGAFVPLDHDLFDLLTTRAGSPLIRAAQGDAGPSPH